MTVNTDTVSDVSETNGVLDELRCRTGDMSLRWATDPRPLTGGFWAALFVVSLASDVSVPDVLRGSLVLRVMPDPVTGRYETEVQRLVHAAGVPVPAVVAAGGSEHGDTAWSLMDLAPGRPPLAGLSAGVALRRGPWLMRRLPDLLAEAAASVHRCAIDGWAERLISAGRDPGVRSFIARVGAAADEAGRPDLAAHARRLGDTAPPSTVLCHGDLHPFNLLVDGSDWTLLDWSTAVLADPHYDLAFTELMLANPPLRGPAAVEAAATSIGRRIARRFIDRYEYHAGTPVDPERLDWARRAHALRALVEVAGWSAAGTDVAHAGHPWLAMRPALERTLDGGVG
jgi:aminoglycoside phosphotransferase (APT) family kinase protein